MLRNALIHSLSQIAAIFDALDARGAAEADALYANTGAGRHVRHIHDHFMALREGLEQGCVDYNRRHRDSPVEVDRKAARQQLLELFDWCNTLVLDERDLLVMSEIDCLQTRNAHFRSNLPRELLYLINHTIHHAAHIKLLLQHAGLELSPHIGIAPGTASFLRESAAKAEAVVCVH